MIFIDFKCFCNGSDDFAVAPLFQELAVADLILEPELFRMDALAREPIERVVFFAADAPVCSTEAILAFL